MNQPHYPQDRNTLKRLGIDFQRDRSGFWRMKRPASQGFASRLKGWTVDRLAEGHFQSDCGLSYWIARAIRWVWGKGFDRA